MGVVICFFLQSSSINRFYFVRWRVPAVARNEGKFIARCGTVLRLRMHHNAPLRPMRCMAFVFFVVVPFFYDVNGVVLALPARRPFRLDLSVALLTRI